MSTLGLCPIDPPPRSPGALGDHEFVWLVDPLDGTTNFAHGFWEWSLL